MLKQLIIGTLALVLPFISIAQETLPASSSLINIDGHKLHINQKGDPSSAKLLLLSGPTDNWHSDSAWMLVLHNYLAQNYHSTIIDRAGQAWSEAIEKPSYQHFAQDLALYLATLDEPVTLVAFASSNLSLHRLLADKKLHSKISGVVLIDPDVLTEHSIKHYTSESDGFGKRFEQLEAYIASGKYDQRIKAKLESESKHLQTLITPELEAFMNWDYYHAIEAIRAERDFQINKFKEITQYRKDLEQAKNRPLPPSIPLIILDSDFEQAYIDSSEDEKATNSMIQWKKEGIEHYFYMAKANNCGSYWPIDTREHLFIIKQPDIVHWALKKLAACKTK